MSITTILQIFKRSNYLKEQLAAIDAQTIKSKKIFIVHNEGDVKFNIPERDDIQYFYSSVNMKFHLRFAIGLLANTEYVSFFDDDTIPGKNWYKNCIETINKHDCICVTNGRVIHHNEHRWDCPGWGNPSEETIKVSFGGHAWFMKKKHLKYMWETEPISWNNGEDMQLSFNCRKFGNISTYVPPHPINDKSKWGSLKGTELGSDAVASWITNPTHFNERWDIIDTYAKLNYKLI